MGRVTASQAWELRNDYNRLDMRKIENFRFLVALLSSLPSYNGDFLTSYLVWTGARSLIGLVTISDVLQYEPVKVMPESEK
jgi:hypothetical protein